MIEGHARFESSRVVRVDGRQLTAPRIFINIGGRPTVPPIGGLADVDYLTSSSMMDVDFLPEHLIVVGGSYIGLEFAQMYRRFGSRVTVVEMAATADRPGGRGGLAGGTGRSWKPRASTFASMRSVSTSKSATAASPCG